jgi:hypothetical protein
LPGAQRTGVYIGEIIDTQLSSNDVYVLQSETGKEILIPP